MCLATLFSGASRALAQGNAHLSQDSKDALTSQGKEFLKQSAQYLDKGNLSAAESNCQQALDLFSEVGLDYHLPHRLVGRIDLLRGYDQVAYDQIGWGWRPGRDPYLDLLMAAAGAKLDCSRSRSLAYSALLIYCMQHSDVVSERVGNPSLLPNVGEDGLPRNKSAADIETTALILLALDPSTGKWEAVQHAQRALKLAPQSPVAQYALGKSLAAIGDTKGSLKALQAAAHDGRGRLVDLAMSAIKAQNRP